MKRVFVICWDNTRTKQMLDVAYLLQTNSESEDGQKAVRFIRQHKPEVIIADLEVRPSHTIATIEPLAKSDVKFIIVDGAPENLAKVKKLLPNAIFTALSDIGNFLT